MAMRLEDDAPHPYFAMVANQGKPTWSDTLVSYMAFYHQLLGNAAGFTGAVEAMRAASSDRFWVVETAEEAKRSFIEYVKSRAVPEQTQQNLEAVAREEKLPPDAKALEKPQTV